MGWGESCFLDAYVLKCWASAVATGHNWWVIRTPAGTSVVKWFVLETWMKETPAFQSLSCHEAHCLLVKPASKADWGTNSSSKGALYRCIQYLQNYSFVYYVQLCLTQFLINAWNSASSSFGPALFLLLSAFHFCLFFLDHVGSSPVSCFLLLLGPLSQLPASIVSHVTIFTPDTTQLFCHDETMRRGYHTVHLTGCAQVTCIQPLALLSWEEIAFTQHVFVLVPALLIPRKRCNSHT